MKKKIGTRSHRAARTQHLLAETLELRQMCSGTLLTLLASPPQVIVNPVAAGAGNLAVDCHGSIWYTAGNSLETPSTNGTTHYLVPAASNGSLRPIVSNLVFTPDNSAWFVVAENGQNRLARMTPTGTFQDMTAVTPGTMAHLTVNQNAVWFIQSNSLVGFVKATGETALFPVPGTTLAALTTGPDGNVWFAGAASTGQPAVGKVTPAGVVQKFAVPDTGGGVGSLVAGNDGYLYAGAHHEIWRVTTTGNVSEFLHGDFTADSLTGAPDGSLWFIDAAHPDRAITRVSGNLLTQYGSGIQAPVTVNSIIATGGNIWFTAVGSSAGWLGKFQMPFSSNLFSGVTYATQLFSDGAIAAIPSGYTLYGGLTALTINGSTRSFLGDHITAVFSQGADTNSSTTGNTSSNTNVSPASSDAVINGVAAPVAKILRRLTHQEVVSGAAANDPADRAATGTSDANAPQTNAAAAQDPATFEGEFRVRTPQGYSLPPEHVSRSYYSSAGRPSRGLVLAEGHWGDVPSAAHLAFLTPQAQPAAAPVLPGRMMSILVLKDSHVAAGNASQPTTSPTPAADSMDWWRLATYVSAASGLQGWGPTNKRYGE